MIYLTDATAHPELIHATARVVVLKKVVEFRIGLKDASKESLETAIDYLEGQVGLVLSIIDNTDSRNLYRSMFNAWEVID